MSCVSYRLLSRTGNPDIVTRTRALLHVRIGPATALGNETVDPRLQHRQRHRAELQHRIVKGAHVRSEEHTSELQSPCNLVCRLLLEKKKYTTTSAARVSTC